MSTTPTIALAINGPLVDPDLAARATEMAKTVQLDVRRPETVQSLGASAQQKSAAVSDQLLAHTRNKDGGEAGNLLGALALKCKGVDVSKLQPGWRDKLTKLPGIGGLFTAVQAEIASYDHTLVDVDKIGAQLTGAANTLLNDVKSLDLLYDQNLAIYQELQLWIQVGKIKLAEVDGTLLPSAQAVAKTSGNPVDAQAYSDMQAHRERLDRRINGLELTAAVRLQEAPSTRLVQSGDLKLADKLQSGVLNTIPIWKDSLALAITLTRQKKAADLMDSVDDTTNALLKANADALHTTSVQIAKSANRGVVDIETLRYTQEKLLATIDETRQIAADGQKTREAARVELESMRLDLQKKLTAGK